MKTCEQIGQRLPSSYLPIKGEKEETVKATVIDNRSLACAFSTQKFVACMQYNFSRDSNGIVALLSLVRRKTNARL